MIDSLKNDIDLIKAIGKGSERELKVLYDSYSEKVYNTALSYVKNIEEAEEITQDVFVSIYKSASGFKGNSKVSTWIYRIAVNTSLNYVSKKKRLNAFRDNVETPQSVDFNHPGVVLENKEKAEALYKATDCLPDSQKTAFILSYIEGLPRQEVADVMETSLKAVESLLQRAKKNMRTELTKMYPNRRKFNK